MGCGCGAASRQHLSFHLVAMAHPSLVNFHCNKAPAHCYSETQIMDRLLEMSECLDRTLRNATGRLLGEPSADNFCFSLPPASLIQLAFNSGFSSPPLISWRSGFVRKISRLKVGFGHTPYITIHQKKPRPFSGKQ